MNNNNNQPEQSVGRALLDPRVIGTVLSSFVQQAVETVSDPYVVYPPGLTRERALYQIEQVRVQLEILAVILVEETLYGAAEAREDAAEEDEVTEAFEGIAAGLDLDDTTAGLEKFYIIDDEGDGK